MTLSAHDFLSALALVLGVAAVTTVLFHKLRQPVVLGYLLAGLLVGPHCAAFPLTADTGLIQALSELGVILLMFSLGLEFRLGELRRVGPTALITAVFQCSLMLWLGYVAGRAFGWTQLESIFAGAAIAISSTTIIARAFEDLNVKEPVRGLVVGILLVEDLVAIVLMAVLTALATGAGVSAGMMGQMLGKLLVFLVAGMVGGLLVVPRLIRFVMAQGREEMVVVTAVGLSFGFAWLAHAAGYSVALGAFIAGSLVAESGEGGRVEVMVRPVRNLFAAVFFVSVGMLFDPVLFLETWPMVLTFTAFVIAGKVVGVSLGVFFTGNGVRTAVQSALSLAQIGEFSFIIVGLGLSLGATRPFLYPVAIAVCALTTLTTPSLIRASPRWAEAIDRRLPRRVQTIVVLYGSWLERLKGNRSEVSPMGKLIRLLLLDDIALIVTLVGLSLLVPRTEGLVRWVVIGLGAGVLLTVGRGLARVLRALGDALAERALPLGGRRVDLARSPRATLAALFRILAAGLVLAPSVAVLTPWLPTLWVSSAVVLVVAALLASFWRRATDFEGHLRAGAEVVAEALHRRMAVAPETEHKPSDSLDAVRETLPGLGEPVSCTVTPGSVAAGRSLGQLNLRGLTGATVLAIHRESGDVVLPTAGEQLLVGDVVALAGSSGAVAAARGLIESVMVENPEGEGGAGLGPIS